MKPLLGAYDIPCIIVLDRDAEQVAKDIALSKPKNVQNIFVLKKGTIEDYYPLEIIVNVINDCLKPPKPVKIEAFDQKASGNKKIDELKKVLHEHQLSGQIGYLKRFLGSVGTKMLKEKGHPIDQELKSIFDAVKTISEAQ